MSEPSRQRPQLIYGIYGDCVDLRGRHINCKKWRVPNRHRSAGTDFAVDFLLAQNSKSLGLSRTRFARRRRRSPERRSLTAPGIWNFAQARDRRRNPFLRARVKAVSPRAEAENYFLKILLPPRRSAYVLFKEPMLPCGIGSVVAPFLDRPLRENPRPKHKFAKTQIGAM